MYISSLHNPCLSDTNETWSKSRSRKGLWRLFSLEIRGMQHCQESSIGCQKKWKVKTCDEHVTRATEAVCSLYPILAERRWFMIRKRFDTHSCWIDDLNLVIWETPSTLFVYLFVCFGFLNKLTLALRPHE